MIQSTLRENLPNTELFSGTYFAVFSPNTGKYGLEITPYLNTFHAVVLMQFNGSVTFRLQVYLDVFPFE